MTLDTQLRVRLEPKTRRLFDDAAEVAGMTLSEFVRHTMRRESLAVLAAADLNREDVAQEDGDSSAE